MLNKKCNQICFHESANSSVLLAVYYYNEQGNDGTISWYKKPDFSSVLFIGLVADETLSLMFLMG